MAYNNKLNKARQALVDEYISVLSADEIPWNKDWVNGDKRHNAITGREYNGVNAFILRYFSYKNNYKDPRWLTFNQISNKGNKYHDGKWHLKKGSKGVAVEYWYFYNRIDGKYYTHQQKKQKLQDDKNSSESDFILTNKVYTVFNAEQIEGIPEYEPKNIQRTEYNIDNVIKTIAKNINVGFKEFGDSAYYSPTRDEVVIPPAAQFKDDYSYHATALHELSHATSHSSRLNRPISPNFGSEEYAKEELRAEISSSFLMQELSIPSSAEHIENHKAYIQNWISVIKKDPNELFRAIKDAEEISDYLTEKGELENNSKAMAAVTLENSQDEKSVENHITENMTLLQYYNLIESLKNDGYDISQLNILDYELEDNPDILTGGISYMGETVNNFLEESDIITDNISFKELNDMLNNSGIKKLDIISINKTIDEMLNSQRIKQNQIEETKNEKTEKVEEKSKENTESDEKETKEIDKTNENNNKIKNTENTKNRKNTENTKNGIQDFGNYIPGARKNEKGLIDNSIYETMTSNEIKTQLTKDNVFGKVDYRKLVNEGYDKRAAFYIKQIRDAIPTRPKNVANSREYVFLVSAIKENLMRCKTMTDVHDFHDMLFYGSFLDCEEDDLPKEIYPTKLRAAINKTDARYLEQEMDKKCFLFTPEEKAKAKIRKDAFKKYTILKYNLERTFWSERDGRPVIIPKNARGSARLHMDKSEINKWENGKYFAVGPSINGDGCDVIYNFNSKEEIEAAVIERYQKMFAPTKDVQTTIDYKQEYLSKLIRKGPDYCNETAVTPEQYQTTLNFYGVQFGNWENDAERQKNLNYSFEAFCDMARAINISVKDISLEGKLGIAYGARGKGGSKAALAHYEPTYKVINLTKEKGAGSLAHEWMHALDHYLYDKYTNTENVIRKDGTYMASNLNIETPLTKIVNAMSYKLNSEPQYTNHALNVLFNEKYTKVNECIKSFSPYVPENKTEDLTDILNNFIEGTVTDKELGMVYFEGKVSKPAEELANAVNEISHTKLTGLEECFKTALFNTTVYMSIKQDFAHYPKTVKTEYLKNAEYLDTSRSKPYFKTNHEMLARAFACYVTDKLNEHNEKNDYLSGHSDRYIGTCNNRNVYAHPEGSERKAINEAFDKAIENLKELGILHNFDEKEISALNKKQTLEKNKSDDEKDFF